MMHLILYSSTVVLICVLYLSAICPVAFIHVVCVRVMSAREL